MKTPDRTDVIQGDEKCRDGHYRAKQDLREKTATSDGAERTAELDPNDPTSLQAQNPSTFGNLRVGPASEEAAGIPETYFTVWANVFQLGKLAAGEHILVHGGSSGIGTTAIQLAKAFGARVVTTAGSVEKCKACVSLGADIAVNYKTEDFVAATKNATGERGADVVLDIIGGDYLDRNYEAAAVEGRVVQIAFQASPRASVVLQQRSDRIRHVSVR